MGGIYWRKQMTTSYLTERNRVKKRYKKQFLRLINISIFNAHIIQEKVGKRMYALTFRMKLTEEIIDCYGRENESAVEGVIVLVWRVMNLLLKE